MKLIVNLKFIPSHEQAASLKKTLERANAACDWISEQGWNHETFKQYALHKLTYHECKQKFELTAQMVVRCVAKVADAYKLDNKTQRRFKKHSSIAYDDRIIRFKGDKANVWTVDGRQTIPFQCGDYQRKLLPFRKGEVDLIYRKGNFYLNAVCDIEEPPKILSNDILGVDFGVVNIVTTSDAEVMSGKAIEKNRRTHAHRRRNLQRKQTKSAKRKLKELAGKQSRYQNDVNHCISKSLVLNAKGTNRSLAIEDLKGIRERVTVRRKQRARLSNCSFNQLRTFLEYKSKLYGVMLQTVDPRNTSRECHRCHYNDKKNRQSQDKFLCQSCGYTANADFNASRNIRFRALSISQTSNLLKASGRKIQAQAVPL